MSGFDVGNVYTAEILPGDQADQPEFTVVQASLLQFLREFRLGEFFVYRDQLLRNLQVHQHWVEVDLEHLSAFDESLTNLINTRPSDILPVFEDAARTYVRSLRAVARRPDEHIDDVSEWQVIIKSNANLTPIRALTADHMSKLVRVPGIVISASTTQAKATKLHIMCRNCGDAQELPLKAGISGAMLPRVCARPRVEAQQAGAECPMDPYLIVPDRSAFVDQQTIKLQEPPESVPVGELPRHMLASCDRALANRAVPGTRVTVVAVYSIFQSKQAGQAPAVRASYLRVVGVELDTAGAGRTARRTFTPAEETEMINLSRQPDIYSRFANSIAPSIFGSTDIKKAIACLLFGGSRKLLPDGMRLRGDINVLLLGDPGTAKSQLLKFVEKVAPIGVYTSGKGSSAAGLTASVVRDAASREFYLEGGAMVLADGGVVCIDEFDKMREEDRVAIHEAMEQQTISIAKAGITTILNSRTSVLAAANPVFGRYDDLKSPGENIDFQSTILSRFDMIFIVKDEHNTAMDMRLAKHVIGVHINAAQEAAVGDIDVQQMKDYISYCKLRCAPRLSPEAAETLSNYFVSIRNEVRLKEADEEQRSSIPVTVRQLEAIIRIAEALAKMTLSAYATERHVDEAIRLFTVSTMNAVNSGQMMEGVMRGDLLKQVEAVERDIRRRLPVGSRIQHRILVDELSRRDYPAAAVEKAIQIMLRREQLRHSNQQRTLERVM